MNIIGPGMVAENTADLISALIRMIQPTTVIEIGSIESAIFIAKALQGALYDWLDETQLIETPDCKDRTALIDASKIPTSYRPQLITIDNFSAEGSKAEEAWSSLRDIPIDGQLISFVQKDFFGIDDTTIESWGPIDVAWIDAGTPADDVRFVSSLWQRIRPGGFLCLHEPVMKTTVKNCPDRRVEQVRTPLWEEIAARFDGTYEFIAIPEVHQCRQNGLGIVRKRSYNEMLVRPTSLQDELFQMGDIPIRSDLLPVGLEGARMQAKRRAVSALIANRSTRRVYAAIILGHSSINDIAAATSMDAKSISKSINRLQSLGLIDRSETGLDDLDSVWKSLSAQNQRDFNSLSDKELEQEEIINRISTAFVEGKPYTETEISNICLLFTDDYARLRRFLVERKILHREAGTYRRVK